MKFHIYLLIFSCLFFCIVLQENLYAEPQSLSLNSAIEKSSFNAYRVIRAKELLKEKRTEENIIYEPKYSAYVNARLLWRNDNVFETDNNINDESPIRRKLSLDMEYKLYGSDPTTHKKDVAVKESQLQKVIVSSEQASAKRNTFALYIQASEAKTNFTFYNKLIEEQKTIIKSIRIKLEKRKILPYLDLKLQTQIKELELLIHTSEIVYQDAIRQLQFFTKSNKDLVLTSNFPDIIPKNLLLAISQSNNIDQVTLDYFDKSFNLENAKVKKFEFEEQGKLSFVSSLSLNNSFTPSSPLFKAGIVYKKKIPGTTNKQIAYAKLRREGAASERTFAEIKINRKLQILKSRLLILATELEFKKTKLTFLEEQYKIFKLKYSKGRSSAEQLLTYFRDYYKGYETFKKTKANFFNILGDLIEITSSFKTDGNIIATLK